MHRAHQCSYVTFSRLCNIERNRKCACMSCAVYKHAEVAGQNTREVLGKA